jgi:hypothetical protein
MDAMVGRTKRRWETEDRPSSEEPVRGWQVRDRPIPRCSSDRTPFDGRRHSRSRRTSRTPSRCSGRSTWFARVSWSSCPRSLDGCLHLRPRRHREGKSTGACQGARSGSPRRRRSRSRPARSSPRYRYGRSHAWRDAMQARTCLQEDVMITRCTLCRDLTPDGRTAGRTCPWVQVLPRARDHRPIARGHPSAIAPPDTGCETPGYDIDGE